MQIGVVYPQNELRGCPDAARRFATAVEALGFHHLLAYDHVLGAAHAQRTPALTSPFTEKDPFHDPLVLFAHLAAITERLEFATSVLVLPSRPTVYVARQAADVDLLAGGRLRLGVGIGRNHVEYQAAGVPFRTRGARQEEQIRLLRRLWSEPLVEFEGRFDRVDRAALLPHPTRSIPIWMGGWGDIAYDRAARIADGFMFFGDATDVVTAWSSVRDRVAHHGRSPEDFGAEYIVPSQHDASGVVNAMEAWREAGGTHSSVVTMGLGLDGVEAHIDYLKQVNANGLPRRRVSA